MHPESERVAYVDCSTSKKRGSGYWVGGNLLLSARHIFQPEEDSTSPVGRKGRVYLGKEHGFRPVTVVWAGEGGTDVALIQLSEQPPLTPKSRPPLWASCNNTDLECVARGYPKFLTFGKVPERDEIKGPCLRGAGTSFDLLHLEKDSIKAQSLDEWKGMSGAGLFCRGYLVGIIVQVAVGRLIAFPIHRLVDTPSFIAKCGELKLRLKLERYKLWPAADEAALRRLRPINLKYRDSSSRAPSELLLAENEVVPFDEELRTNELDVLREFTVDEGPALLVFTGPGGAGKTRLMVEWCRRQRARGWIAGFVDTDSGDDLAKVAEGESPRLLVLDYPERRVAEVAAICKRMLQQDPLSVRLVLLARSRGSWFDELRKLTKADLVADARLYPLQKMTQLQRRTTFERARGAFAGGVTADGPNLPDEELEPDDFPLYAHMRALLRTTFGEARPPEDPEQLLRKLLDHEKEHWKQHIDGGSLDGAQRMMAAVTLLGDFEPGPDALLRWLWPALGLGAPPPRRSEHPPPIWPGTFTATLRAAGLLRYSRMCSASSSCSRPRSARLNCVMQMGNADG